MVNIHLDAAFDHMEAVEMSLPPNERKILTDARRFIEKKTLREVERYHNISPEAYSALAQGVENVSKLLATLSAEELIVSLQYINQTINAVTSTNPSRNQDNP